uniref:KIB1-4 beta-propeller domain-containing protein n=1 Tax=Hordeum vulgare subsp. vulgare TaxID=112509 RepID=A0A8I6YKQ5_HORVV
MGLSLGKITCSPWPDLPPDIVGLILSRLLCHTDRASFAAVCNGWRLAARQLSPSLPTAVPCITFGRSAYQSLTDDNVKVRHIAAPRGFRAGATFGSWVLYEHKLSGRCFLHNPSSPSTPPIEVPCRYLWSTSSHSGDVVVGDYEPCMAGPLKLEKMVVCSSDLVVAVFDKVFNFRYFLPETQPPTLLFWDAVVPMFGDEHRGRSFIKDITFHRGKVFTITQTEDLFAYDLVRDTPVLQTRVQHVIKEDPAADVPPVFEADMENKVWSEVKDLGGQVLFVGRSGSRALAAVDSHDDYNYNDPRFRGGNPVFILGNDWARVWSAVAECECSDCQKLVNSMPTHCVYDMASGKASLVSPKGHHSPMRSYRSEWFFPSE